MKNYDGRIVGILGTVIFHLIAAIIFMSFQIRSLKVETRDMFAIEFIPEEIKTENELTEIPVTTIERVLQGDEEMLNIARNLAKKADPRINKDDYIDQVKEELIKSGKLNASNYIDEQKQKAQNPDENSIQEK